MTATEKRLFLAELRAGRPSALKRLRQALKACNGSAPQAARELGIGVQTLYDAKHEQQEVANVFERHAVSQQTAAKRWMTERHQKKSKNRQ